MPSVDTVQTSHPFHRRHKNAILLATLLILILASPLIEFFGDSQLTNMLLTSVVMVTSINAISRRKRSSFFWAISLAALAVISGWTQAFNNNHIQGGHSVYLFFSHVFGAVLYIYIAALLFKVILIEDEITVDQIFAGVVIYILIGLTWAHCYALVGIYDPESIQGISASINDNESDYIYFSFITLTTLGYGDMLPTSSVTKSLVIVEAITGVMFVTILVSTLVGRVNMKR